MTRDAARSLLDRLEGAGEKTVKSLIGGALRTQAIYVAAKLGIADHLALGPRSALDLAERVHADAAKLHRVLRFLVANGVFTEGEDGRFGLGRAAESLQTAHPFSLRGEAIRAGEQMWPLAGRLLHAVETGETPHDTVHGASFFERLAAEGRTSAFAAGMNRGAARLGAVIAGLDCVARARTVVDVGGGHGGLIAALLGAHRHLRGVLLDSAPAIEGARRFLGDARLLDRIELRAGSFFDSVPAGGDVYVLSWILHDWDDARAARILRACRTAAGEQATLLVVEVLLPPRTLAADGGADVYALDLNMLLLTGGRERTIDDYRALLRDTGWAMAEPARMATTRGASVIEARLNAG